MKCPVCNAQIADGSKFCVHCGSKIEAESETKAAPPVQVEHRCSSCGASLKPGAKFCPKCGAKQEEIGTEEPNTSEPANKEKTENPAASKPVKLSKPSNSPAEVAPQTQQESDAEVSGQAGQKVNTKAILIAAAALLVLGGGGFLAIRGINASHSAESPSKVAVQESIGAKNQKGSEENEQSETQSTDEAGSEEAGAAQEKGDEYLFKTIDELAQKAQAEYDEKAYQDAHRDSKKALQNYLSTAEKNNLKQEAQRRIEDVYGVYVDSIIAYGEVLEVQQDHLAASRYDAIKDMTDPAKRLTEEIKASGYSIDSEKLEEYSSGLAGRYKDFYIRTINTFADSEETGTPWPRDDAWKYASDAYSIQENGRTVLFDENDLDDPLRLRYEFCLAWITTKRCEQGIKDGSLDAGGAAEKIEAILEETDYNPLLLQTYVNYAKQAGMGDVDKYQRAYDMIINKIKEEQNLTIDANNTGVYTGNKVDLRYFRYFNDLDGEEEYLVDDTNGTRAVTRAWIRDNIPDVLE